MHSVSSSVDEELCVSSADEVLDSSAFTGASFSSSCSFAGMLSVLGIGDSAGHGISFDKWVPWRDFPVNFFSDRFTERKNAQDAVRLWAFECTGVAGVWTRRIWSDPRKCSPMTMAINSLRRETLARPYWRCQIILSNWRHEKQDVTNAILQDYPWTLVFSTSENGFSLRSLYRKMMAMDSSQTHKEMQVSVMFEP